MWKLVIILLFIGVKIKGEENDCDCEGCSCEENACEECNMQIDYFASVAGDYLHYYEPYTRGIPDCEYCEITQLKNLARNGDSCVTEKDGCSEQISHFVLDSAYINCSCELHTKSGKKTGGIHGAIGKVMFSIRIISCSKPTGTPHFYEDGIIGADKLHITCDGDEEFTKACEEEEHGYNVDDVVVAVGNSVVDLINSKFEGDGDTLDCRISMTPIKMVS